MEAKLNLEESENTSNPKGLLKPSFSQKSAGRGITAI
jgi:hypothetical protein